LFKKNIFNINQIKRELDQKSKTSSRSSQFGKLKKKKIQEIRKCEIRELIDSNLKSSVILNVCLMLTFKIFDFVCLVWFGLKKKKKKKKKNGKKQTFFSPPCSKLIATITLTLTQRNTV